MKKNILLTCFLALLVACGETKEEPAPEVKIDNTELFNRARAIFAALPESAENPDNPGTPEKIALGKKLYFDVRLSKDDTQSCNTCHDLNNFGVDNKPTSEGNKGGKGTRNSPTVFNAALHMAQFWDGREPDVEAQAGGPIINPVEMEMANEKVVVSKLSKISEYKEMFAAAFPDDPKITYDNIKKAIGAFERKLLTPNKFDKFITGDDNALTAEEVEGMKVFMDSGCITCHTGSLLGGNMYQKFGLFGDYLVATKSEKIDNGRFDVTKNEAEKYFFKVPSLRNVTKTAPYFHDGSVADLNEANKIMAKLQLNKDLTDDELNKIAVFLEALTGDIPNEFKQ